MIVYFCDLEIAMAIYILSIFNLHSEFISIDSNTLDLNRFISGCDGIKNRLSFIEQPD